MRAHVVRSFRRSRSKVVPTTAAVAAIALMFATSASADPTGDAPTTDIVPPIESAAGAVPSETVGAAPEEVVAAASPSLAASADQPAVVTSGGSTTVQYTVINDGSVSVDAAGIEVVASNCVALAGPFGDDGDGVLEPEEQWTYGCSITAPVIDGSGASWTDAFEVRVLEAGSIVESSSVTSTWLPVTIRRVLYRYWNGDASAFSLPYLHPDGSTAALALSHDDVPAGEFTISTSEPLRIWSVAGVLSFNRSSVPAGYVAVDTAPLVVAAASTNEATVADVVTADLSVSVSAPATVRRNTSFAAVYTVRNEGPAAAVPRVADYRCAPVRFVTGDFDRDGVLDPGETWTYRCARRASARANVTFASFALVLDDAEPREWLVGGDPDTDDNAAFWSVRTR